MLSSRLRMPRPAPRRSLPTWEPSTCSRSRFASITAALLEAAIARSIPLRALPGNHFAADPRPPLLQPPDERRNLRERLEPYRAHAEVEVAPGRRVELDVRGLCEGSPAR